MNAFSSWPTAKTTDVAAGRGATLIGSAYYRPSPALDDGRLVGQANLSDVAEQWRTPDAPQMGGTRNRPGSQGRGHQVTIAEQAESWPTPQSHDATTGKTPDQVKDHRRRTGAGAVNLNEVAELWPTATAEDAESSGRRVETGPTLTAVAQLWPTAQALAGGAPDNNLPSNSPLHRAAAEWQTPTDPGWATRRQVGSDERQALLRRQAETWPTPSTEDGEQAKAHKGGNPMLESAAVQWTTPTEKDGSHPSRTSKRGSLLLTGQADDFRPSPQDQPTPTPGPPSSSAGPTLRRRPKLNPLFVEWLMGWPVGWTSLEPLDCGLLETESSHYKQLMRTAFCALASPDR